MWFLLFIFPNIKNNTFQAGHWKATGPLAGYRATGLGVRLATGRSPKRNLNKRDKIRSKANSRYKKTYRNFSV